MAEQNNEIVLLRKELEIQKTEKESLQLTIEQLRINVNKEAEALRKELIKEKANYESHVEKLKLELDTNIIKKQRTSGQKRRTETEIKSCRENEQK